MGIRRGKWPRQTDTTPEELATCDKKKGFKTKAKAKAFAFTIPVKRKMWAYRCPHCPYWHLTSMDRVIWRKWVKRAAIREVEFEVI